MSGGSNIDLQLYRTDFAQVGTMNRGCMKVVPSDRTKTDKKKSKPVLDRIIVGSQNGSIVCFERKGNETKIEFKTPPGPPIEAIVLGGSLNSFQNKVLVTSENSVRGIGRKGKQFLGFETRMAEKARRMFVTGIDLVMTGQKTYNHYHDCADANYVVLPDDIHDVIALPTESWSERGFVGVVACNDSTIKVLNDSRIEYDVEIVDVPYTLCLYKNDGGSPKNLVCYGTRNGRLGMAMLPPKKGDIIWEIETRTASAITSILFYKFVSRDEPDILIGKEDGMIEIYKINGYEEPIYLYSYSCDESITAISCGQVSKEGIDEIIVNTYTGWLFSLSKSPLNTDSAPLAATVNVKVQQLKSEVEELEAKVAEERSRYTELTKRTGGNSATYVPNFQVHHKFEFNQLLGAYTLNLEMVVPIEFLIIKGDLPGDLLDSEKNAAVTCKVSKNEYNPWPILASYRCQPNITRMEIRIRFDEGHSGTITVYICPKFHPKMAQVYSFDVMPLSSHIRTHNFDESRPMNVLSFSGTFTQAEVHSWVIMLVPGIPPKCPSSETIMTSFMSAASGTQLQITYSKGSAVFRSDSMTVISIIRDRINQMTIERQMRANITCDLNEDSIPHCLKLLDPKMSAIHKLNLEMNMAKALKEVEANSEDVDFFSDEQKRLLKDYEKIVDKAQKEPELEHHPILNIYEDLLVSRAKLHGGNIRNRVELLRELLIHSYSLDDVTRFFEAASEEAQIRKRE